MSEKPKRNYYCVKSNTKYIQPSSAGLFFTVNGNDNRAVREVYNLLDLYITNENLNNLNQTEVEEKEKENDVSDLLTKMCAETANNKKKQKFFF